MVTSVQLVAVTVTAVLADARDVPADRKLLVLDDATWTQFLAMLDRPVSPKPRLGKLFAGQSWMTPQLPTNERADVPVGRPPRRRERPAGWGRSRCTFPMNKPPQHRW